jgi:hypothetical protein
MISAATREPTMTTVITTRSRRTYTVGRTADLPDGPTVTVSHIERGEEYGEPVFYITGKNRLGTTVTRWVSA